LRIAHLAGLATPNALVCRHKTKLVLDGERRLMLYPRNPFYLCRHMAQSA
jgi:hypothetical protein